MLVECSYCGAPLDVREGAKLVKCRYCGSVSERQKQKTVAQQTPKDFRPPPLWKPPENMPADSNQELKYKKNHGGCIAAVIIAATLAIPLLVGGTKLLQEAGIGAPDGADLAKLNIAQKPSEVGDALDARATESSVYAKLDSDRYEFVTFSYDDKHLDHPRSIYFKVKDSEKPDPKLKAALEQRLSCKLDENGSWRWNDANLSIDAKTGSIGFGVDPDSPEDPHPYWKRQLQALWRIVVSAAFNQKLPVAQAEAQEVLGTGYPFARLKEVIDLTVENAQSGVTRVFPGSVFEDSRMQAEIAVDHPLFRYAEIEWKNEKGARMSSFGLRDRPEGYIGRHAEVAKCLTPALGAPQVNETDYLKKKADYTFRVASGDLHVSETWLYLSTSKPIENDEWTKIVTAIDACRK